MTSSNDSPWNDEPDQWGTYVEALGLSDRYDLLSSTPVQELGEYGNAFHELFGEIHEDEELLREMYVAAGVGRSDDESLTSQLHTIPPVKLSQVLEKRRFDDFAEACRSEQLIYLIGPIGRGKTTFLHYQLTIEIPLKYPGLAISPVLFDVRGCGSPEEFHRLFVDEVDRAITRSFPFFASSNEEELHRTYCDAFHTRMLNDLVPASFVTRVEDRADYDAQARYFQELRSRDLIGFNVERLNYARRRPDGRSIRMILVVDNADQHLVLEGGEAIIRHAHAIALRLRLPLILSLRNTSFRKNNAAFIQSGFTPRFLFLTPAPASEVVARRLTRLYELTSDDKSLQGFIGALNRHLMKGEPMNRERVHELVRTWVEPLGNGSKREMLLAIRMLLASVHLTTSRWDELRSSANDYLSPDFELMVAKVKLAFISGRQKYHDDADPGASYVMNLFLPGQSDFGLPNLLRLKILQYLYVYRDRGATPSEVRQAFIDVLGPSHRPIIDGEISKLIERGLAVLIDESDALRIPLIRRPLDLIEHLHDRLHISECGQFHIKTLIFDDIYLDEMKFVTPLPSRARSAIFRNYRELQHPDRPIRHDSTIAFLHYLDDIERSEAGKRLSRIGLPPILHDMVEAYKEAEKRMNSHQGTGRTRRRWN